MVGATVAIGVTVARGVIAVRHAGAGAARSSVAASGGTAAVGLGIEPSWQPLSERLPTAVPHHERFPMWKSIVVISAVAFLITNASAAAQTKAQPKPRSAASLECSKQADEKGLKGKPRKKFRSKCLKDMKKKAT